MGRGAELVYNVITLFALVGVVAVLVVVGTVISGVEPLLYIPRTINCLV